MPPALRLRFPVRYRSVLYAPLLRSFGCVVSPAVRLTRRSGVLVLCWQLLRSRASWLRRRACIRVFVGFVR
jgi:hypothetical protein